MTTLYFLDGLGSNHYYVADLLAELGKSGLAVTYLPLPGHPGNHQTVVCQHQDLLYWLDETLPQEPCLLLGYSLGGDLATAYAQARPERVAALVLLDGACHDLAGYPEAQELADARAYLTSQVFWDMAEHLSQVRAESSSWSANLEQAETMAYVQETETGRYRLNLVEETVLGLLKVRRQVGPVLQQPEFKVPTRVLISDQPEPALAQKQAFLATCSPTINYAILPDSYHSFVMDKPVEAAALIVKAVEELGYGNH